MSALGVDALQAVVCKTAEVLVHSRDRSRPEDEQEAIFRCLRLAVGRLESARAVGVDIGDLETVGAWSGNELDSVLRNREVTDGPYVRELSDGRVQFYAHVRRTG